MAYFLAVDLGTTGCRSLIFDEGLQVLSSAYREYGLLTPAEKCVEQSAELWWELTLQTAAQAIADCSVCSRDIRGISISSQGITVVPVDRELNPLCNALTWLDVRAEEERDIIAEDIGDREIFLHTGKMNTPAYTLPKLLWLKRNRPDVWEKTYKFLMPMDYLTAKLTGKCVTDCSMASGTLFYDIENGCWSKQILAKYGIREDQLPTIMESGQCAGLVKPEVAALLGLSPECIVAVGAQDQKCAARGVGLDMETVTVSLGTAAAIEKLWDRFAPEQCMDIPWSGYCTKDRWVTEGVIGTAGTSLRWVRDLMFPGEDYDLINNKARQAIENGSNVLFVPYLSGPNGPEYYPDSCGVFYGMSLATGRGDLAAAVMEGVAFRIRLVLEAMQAADTKRIVLFGGGAKGDLWPQIIADVTGLQISVPTTAEAASAGAAILAAQGCGMCAGTLKTAKVFTPSARKQYYESKFEKFKQLEKKLFQEETV